MLINTDDGIKLSEEKVVFEKNGKQEENIVGNEGKNWWLELEEKHDNINIIEFTSITHEKEVLDRFEEIKNENLDFGLAEKYVIDGEITEKLFNLKLKKQEQLIADLTETILLGGM